MLGSSVCCGRDAFVNEILANKFMTAQGARVFYECGNLYNRRKYQLCILILDCLRDSGHASHTGRAVPSYSLLSPEPSQDQSGAHGQATPKITVKSLETGFTRAVSTDEEGYFGLLSLPLRTAGELRVERLGFKVYRACTRINLLVGQEAVVNVVLDVAPRRSKNVYRR